MNIQQEDWDKIEEIPETETNKSTENPVRPITNIETIDFFIDEKEQRLNKVNEWLASFESLFSAPITSSQSFTEEMVKPIHQITSKVQIHSKSKKVIGPERETIKMNIQQEDWDKIEEIPETETNKSTENPVRPITNIETIDFFIDEKEQRLNEVNEVNETETNKSDKILKINSDNMTSTHIIKVDNPIVESVNPCRVNTDDIKITIEIDKLKTNICIEKKKSNKRVQDTCNTDLINNKKMRHSKESIEEANINADMDLQKTGTSTQLQTQISNTQKSNTKNFVKPIKSNIKLQDDLNKSNQQKNNQEINDKNSESVFSNNTEKEYFEDSLLGPSQIFRRRARKLCVASSYLTKREKVMLKELCDQQGWTYVDKFTKDLTHLVVRVDEKNRAQRSIKFVRAVASSKWIVSFEWVETCFLLNGYMNEEPFEVLDISGEPGPRRSRLVTAKLLRGLIFDCLPPFTMLDIETLEDILKASGARIGTKSSGPVHPILLAEHMHTPTDVFKYLAKKLKVVPMNYMWAIDSLCTYTLRPIRDQLLCPAPLLPELISSSDE